MSFEISNNNSVVEVFGQNVFNDKVMRERLPKATFKSFKKTIDENLPLKSEDAEVVANAMKDWAIEKGATHFTHWFQPMTGITAEKHDSFISPTSDGSVIMEFSGKELIKGEPDASSFPSGGLRVTFEARGYTAWDCTSPAFLKEDPSGVTLCIPTIFCSYTGETLDKKTPLLRSMEVLSKQAMRILSLFGNTTTKKVITTVGAEQEYFLIDKEMYDQRKDLIFTGRTLFGAKPPKGQELEDHYFGSIKDRVSAFMKDLDNELWKLGILAKTKHNEVAPSQHELAPIFTTTNIATDNNQVVMETMKKIALRHGLVCLLHEKPFAGVNGSGKHNNWSMSTDDGTNLLDPGCTPHENAQFLVFLSAVIKAVHEYSDLLRVSAANPGNDHRLGGNEAPPAIISVFLGNQLTDILQQIENGTLCGSIDGGELIIGVSTLPKLPKDATDRNRTSPFAFTGNKFEFRMVPSSSSISAPNFTLNLIVADALEQFANRLEKATDFNNEVQSLLKDVVTTHKDIIFNGNNYSEEWVTEAKKRGLPNISNCVDAIPCIIADKNINLFKKHGVMSENELHSRYEISLEHYNKALTIEALTMLDIANKEILPSCINYSTLLAQSINEIKATEIEVNINPQSQLLKEICNYTNLLSDSMNELTKSTKHLETLTDNLEYSKYIINSLIPKMNDVRTYADTLEMKVSSEFWPFPTYSDILYSV